MRVDEMSTGRLGELVIQVALNDDPADDITIVPAGVLAELARRARTVDDLIERRRTKATGP